jgi:two-component system osmolarity sensor histidine kinase EnvZ
MLKKILPHSLFGRFLMIILLPNIMVQLVAVYIFYERHWSGVSKHMTVALASEISMIVQSVEQKSLEDIEGFVDLVNQNMYLDVAFSMESDLPKTHIDLQKDFKVLLNELQKKISYPYSIGYVEGDSKIEVDIQLAKGTLHIITSKKRISNPSTYIFIMWMIGAAFIFLVISILFMRTQVRSIINVAVAAEKFGKGQDDGKFKPSGATEVRKVGRSFIAMRNRINKQIKQRTEMLAGVSHDLKTPLTRIKLQLAMMEQSKTIKELQEDIVEMEKMIQGYLDFAKGKERVIDAAVNISDLLRSVVAGYRHQHRMIDLKTKHGVILHVNANSFRRAVANIIDNALRYGNKLEINSSTLKNKLIVLFDDDGPGIAEKERKLVFKPFYKIDSSRHLENGSTGLGLTIAQDIIVSYGGKIILADSPLGGLRVRIEMPL